MSNISVDLEGYTFVLNNGRIDVYNEARLVATLNALDSDGLPRVGTRRDLESEAMFFLYEFNVI